MIALAEDRLELAVESYRLGPGEAVIVVTKMGDEVARGTVIEVYPDASVYMRESNPDKNATNADRIYAPELYSFIPISDDRGESNVEPDGISGPDIDDDPVSPPISEQDPDVRAERKMKDSGTKLEPKTNGDDASGEGDDSGSGEPRSNVNVDALPDHLKKEIIGLQGLDEAARNEVITAISDAALRALRDVGVRDTEVYTTIVKIQKAVGSALGM